MSFKPEHNAPPEVYYDECEADKYTRNSHIIDIQTALSERAIELLGLTDGEVDPKFVLDIGCGSGLSGDCLADNGHFWCGVDISPAMLNVAVERCASDDDEESNSHRFIDCCLSDIGHGVPFKSGVFDSAISISVLQWLCHSHQKEHHPPRRLYRFFTWLYASLVRGARAVLQVYPENAQQLDLIMSQATRAGFTGGVVVDFPHSTKAKKVFIILDAGSAGNGHRALPLGLTDQQNGQATFIEKQRSSTKTSSLARNSKDWIKAKKARWRRQGREVRPDTKYTGRKRKAK